MLCRRCFELYFAIADHRFGYLFFAFADPLRALICRCFESPSCSLPLPCHGWVCHCLAMDGAALPSACFDMLFHAAAWYRCSVIRQTLPPLRCALPSPRQDTPCRCVTSLRLAFLCHSFALPGLALPGFATAPHYFATALLSELCRRSAIPRTTVPLLYLAMVRLVMLCLRLVVPRVALPLQS